MLIVQLCLSFSSLTLVEHLTSRLFYEKLWCFMFLHCVGRYVDNVCKNPTEEKYRKIKISNKVFQVRRKQASCTQCFSFFDSELMIYNRLCGTCVCWKSLWLFTCLFDSGEGTSRGGQSRVSAGFRLHKCYASCRRPRYINSTDFDQYLPSNYYFFPTECCHLLIIQNFFSCAHLSWRPEEEEEFLVLPEPSSDDLELMKERRDRLQRGEPVRAQLDRQPQVFRPSAYAQHFELPQEFYNLTAEELKKEQQQRYHVITILLETYKLIL